MRDSGGEVHDDAPPARQARPGPPPGEGASRIMVRGVFRFRGRSRPGSEANGAILTQHQHELQAEEAALLDRLAAILEEYPAAKEDRDAIEQAKEHLTALFLLVIVGEFNAGKSAFINALIGEEVMPEASPRPRPSSTCCTSASTRPRRCCPTAPSSAPTRPT